MSTDPSDPEFSAARGEGASVVRVRAAQGLGARWPGQFAIVTAEGRISGSVLGGSLDDRLSTAVPSLRQSWPTERVAGLLDFELDRDDAERAGLPCAGRASVLVQPVAAIPDQTWADVSARRPTALLTWLDDPDAPTTSRPTGACEPEDDGSPEAVADRLMGRAEPADCVVETARGRVLVSVLVPSPRLVVVGSGGLADALDPQLMLLGWSTTRATTAGEGVAAVRALGPGDGVLVIDHRGEVDAPILAEALEAGVGYVAALGSRRTQEARRTRLRDLGLRAELIGRLRGPAGLDIGSRTPAEIAVAIVAEMLAVRAEAAGGALRDGSGSINQA
jgi:xanthine dehydrogenase accessory factor